MAGCLAAWGAAAAQYQETVTIRGDITTVEPPNGFVLAGHPVRIDPDTEFVSFYHTRKNASQLRQDIEVGMWAEVVGSKDHSQPEVVAAKITLRDDDGRKMSGAGVIVHVIRTSPVLTFFADGYTLRVAADTSLKFKGDLEKLDDLKPGDWIRYVGSLNTSDEIVLKSASFGRFKHRIRIPDPKEDQVAAFPPGSFIDFDGSFGTDRGTHKMEDAGGCGWNPVVEDADMQVHVRKVGRSLIPDYQRDLEFNDPAKIPFRFYVIVEKDIRSDLACHRGLVTIPLEVVERLQNDDQLAAVLADGIAAHLQMPPEREFLDLGLLSAAEIAARSIPAVNLGASVAKVVVAKEALKTIEDDRGRVALGLMADAGYDPWQAPEAWRLLAPGVLPANTAKLKDPPRSSYLKEILGLEYKKGATETRAEATVSQAGQKQ
jgi:hypothetical protein